MGASSEPCKAKALRELKPDELGQILRDHQEWLRTENAAGGRRGRRAVLRDTDLSGGNLKQAELDRADLSGARLIRAKLSNARLRDADLTCAQLDRAILKGAVLDRATLSHALLLRADLTEASLFEAKLEGSNLWHTIFVRADLDGADLTGAKLVQTNLDGARLHRAILKMAVYRPANAPSAGYVAGLRGVEHIRLDQPDYAGLAQLRSALKTAGLNEAEREVTYVIERWRTLFLLEVRSDSQLYDAWARIQAALRWLLFDATTAYGRHPEQALWLLLALWVVCTAVHLRAFARRAWGGRRPAGVFVTAPATRVVTTADGFAEAGKAEVRRLAPASVLGRLGWAAYYSLLSTLSIGFREFNFQTWLLRLQREEATYQAVGWVRVASGAQSLVGLYLVAIFLLTYFGRPFE